MMVKYKYELNGTAAQEQTWTVVGEIEIAGMGDFPSVPQVAMMRAFEQLTRGKATYGNPGVGCVGPYRVSKLTVELANE